MPYDIPLPYDIPDRILITVGIAVFFILSGIIGSMFGRAKDRGFSGFFLGGLFGPLGWILVLLLPYGGGRCPKCKTHYASGAKLCGHCGEKLGKIEQVRKKMSSMLDKNNFSVGEKTVRGIPKVSLEYKKGEKNMVKTYPKSWTSDRIVEAFRQALQKR